MATLKPVSGRDSGPRLLASLARQAEVQKAAREAAAKLYAQPAAVPANPASQEAKP